MISISADDVPQAYTEMYYVMKVYGKEENSRNGKVLTIMEPFQLTIDNPMRRVLFDATRNANPFFHVMETVWMLAGGEHVGFPAKFNRTYVNYAEADGIVHGAYGKRWRDHFAPKEIGPRFRMDQIQVAIALLKKDPESRQVVLSMWDPAVDLGATVRDRPCNTHIYFRARSSDKEILNGYELDMTVCNRSNDLLWGMLGANVVHMTYLQELIAFGAGMEVGKYRVFTNNCHVYSDREDVKKYMSGPSDFSNSYHNPTIDYMALLDEGETVTDLLEDCEIFVHDTIAEGIYKTKWMRKVAVPMLQAWVARRDGRIDDLFAFIDRIEAKDWRLACRQWTERKIQSSAI